MNPALDITVRLDQLGTGKYIPARQVTTYPGGKGINAGKALASMGIHALCLGFIGTAHNPLWQTLRSPKLTLDLLAIDGTTRSNITLIEAGNIRHIVSPGFRISENDFQTLLTRLTEQSRPGDWWLLSGSLPPGAPEDAYAHLITLARQLGCHTALDSHGTALAHGLNAAPDWLKINQQEFSALQEDSMDDQVTAARKQLKANMQGMVITHGAHGATLISRDRVWRIGEIEPAPVVVNTMGAGDAFLAGFISAIATQAAPQQALKQGTACALANLQSEEPGRFDAMAWQAATQALMTVDVVLL
ncbi:MAG: hexose kinase [Methylococcales bacterium]|nr:hexose kinase [Methylococcales bacterium]